MLSEYDRSCFFDEEQRKDVMMNYLEWAEEYRQDALRVRDVIEKKKALLNDKTLSADSRKRLNDVIIAYRCIYRELTAVAEHLRGRAEGVCYEI